MAKILVVEDDFGQAENVADWLTFDHHTVECAHNGDEAWDLMAITKYDLLVLDWDMPGIKGIDICVKMRSKGDNTPVLMLTAKNTLRDKETGLDSGADDYLTKPFQMRELSARVRALLRRASASTSNVLRVGSITLDTKAYNVCKDGVSIHLTPAEFTLLEFLMRHPNEVFSADGLLARVRDSGSEATSEAIKTSLRRLRQKLGENDNDRVRITNIHGIGYKLELV